MRNIKRLLSVFIALTFILTVFSGCSNSGSNENNTVTLQDATMPEAATTIEETTEPELKIETSSDSERIYENVSDYTFIPDDRVLGVWQFADYVQNIEDFNPDNLQNPDINYFQNINFIDNGTATFTFDDYNDTCEWTKGYLIWRGWQVVPAYTVKNINNTDYIFIELKSGDYTNRRQKPWYYVLKKVSADDIKYYYLNHKYPNEQWYSTVLSDISKVGKNEPIIALREQPCDYTQSIRFDESSLSAKDEIWAYDMRSCDVSQMDLSVIKSYNDITFDSLTKFPADSAKLPAGFNEEYMLEYNKNPGLGIRELHEQGITGAGVSIAIIDQGLLPDHEQYKDNLMYYERIHSSGNTAAMHGSAVSSIAVGKSIGVAPDAKLYYIADTNGHYLENGDYEFDASIIADCILRILDINKNLPENEKIRVISISRGYNANDKGYKEITEAIDKANSENVFVITTSTDMYYKNFIIYGADRDYLANPDDFKSYEPASWIRSDLYSGVNHQNDTIFPMGSRTYASCTGEQNYEIGYEGGLSWAVPWCAGFYALCCQVKPDITPQEFIEVVNATSISAESINDGKTYIFGKIVNPVEVIKTLQDK